MGGVGSVGPDLRMAWLDRCVTVDLCFWESGDGDFEKLYEDAAEGIDHTFTSSARVLAFRADLLRLWPDLADSIEPLEYDPDFEAPSDLSRYVLVAMHASKSDRMSEMVELAPSTGSGRLRPAAGHSDRAVNCARSKPRPRS